MYFLMIIFSLNNIIHTNNNITIRYIVMVGFIIIIIIISYSYINVIA